ncbi:unnamed protein product [Absidia cylindrospora]
MTLAQQRHSSSTFIAHLLLQQYPPKVQPQSSSARDHALFGHLDKVDAEAGCILIALANHDKRKDMNDLIPYSIRVIDYDQTAGSNSAMDISSSSSSSSSTSSSDSSSSASDGASPHTDNEDPTTTTILTTEKPDNNGTMSISNLLEMNGKLSSSSDAPALSGMTDPPSNTDQSSSTTKMPATTPSSLTTSQRNDINDQPEVQPSRKRKPRTDPILLLAAAAKAIDQDEQLQQRAHQKRKYSEDESSMDSRSHSAQARHHVEGQTAAFDQRQSEKSKFSYQYLSMKQNPKIKRNAMHAYITYMIYTDLASSDKMYHQDKDTLHQSTAAALPPPSTTSSYPLPPSPYPTPTTTTTTSQRTAVGPAPTLKTSSSSSPSPMTFDQQHPSYSFRRNISATGTTGTNAPSSETAWPYGLTSLSSPPPPPPSIHSGSTNPTTGNSSIMARPLTAFLRDDMYT